MNYSIIALNALDSRSAGNAAFVSAYAQRTKPHLVQRILQMTQAPLPQRLLGVSSRPMSAWVLPCNSAHCRQPHLYSATIWRNGSDAGASSSRKQLGSCSL